MALEETYTIKLLGDLSAGGNEGESWEDALEDMKRFVSKVKFLYEKETGRVGVKIELDPKVSGDINRRVADIMVHEKELIPDQVALLCITELTGKYLQFMLRGECECGE